MNVVPIGLGALPLPQGKKLRRAIAQGIVQTSKRREYRRYGRWFLLALLAALVDGNLLLAIAAGTLAYRTVTLPAWATGQRVTDAWAWVQRQYRHPQRRPWLFSASAFGGVYLIATLRTELGGWAALGFLSLGLGNLAAIAALGQRPAPPLPPRPPKREFQDPWQDLTAPDALKRLMAIRHLTRRSLETPAATQVYLPGSAVTLRSHLADCFHLMLVQETEPIVRTALLESLRLLHPKAQLPEGQPPLPPMAATQHPVNLAQTVEYVDSDPAPGNLSIESLLL
jgi:hypothetical protein